MKRNVESILLIISPQLQHGICKDRVLVGSAPNCDIVLEHPSISHYHALIEWVQGGGFCIRDLGSINGTFINGMKVDKSYLSTDDTLTIGKMHIEVSSWIAESFQLTDAQVEQPQEVETKIYVPQKQSANQVLIDDEYCDIIFDEQQQITLDQLPLANAKLATEDFVELDDLQESYDILEKTDGLALQVSTVVNGVVLEQSYIKIQDSTIYASGVWGPSRVRIDLLDDDARLPFISISGGRINVHPLPGFDGLSSERPLGNNDIIIQSQRSYQVFVELVPAPSRLKYISQMRRDKDFYKQSSKVLAGILLPMFLLMLVDFTIPEPPKKLAIIYREPMQSANQQQVASETPEKTQDNTGHKKTEQDKNKLEFAQAAAAKQQQTKQAAAKPAAAAPTPVKAYEFKMDTSNLFASSTDVSVAKDNSPSSLTGATTAAVDSKVVGTATGEVGKMGQDSRGRGTASFGTKGLSNMAGSDTAYIEPKTVVMGSMDPELLRKILREYLPQFRHCYQQELVNNADDIKGVVDLNFEINNNGKVSQINVKAKDSRFSRRGTDCMAQVLSIIDFPRPKGGGRVAVRQPLNFFAEKERS